MTWTGISSLLLYHVESLITHIHTVIPLKVEEAIKQYKYVPYVAITPAAHLQAFHNSDEAFSFNIQGNLVANNLDCSKKWAISLVS
jgi:hypothetical protein